MMRALRWLLVVVVACLSAAAAASAAERSDTIDIRGKAQTLHLYGAPAGEPVVLTSGDGGWIHVAPILARWLGDHGYFVVGVDARAYLESFTSAKGGGVSRGDVAMDFTALEAYASRSTGKPPVLVGVSEGAGLSVLAAADANNRMHIAGVVGVGLPAVNELAWRWRDAVIYVTHGIPNEPTFTTDSVIGQLSPVPLAVVQSTHDDFVADKDIRHLMDVAGDPKKLWFVAAADHNFSDNKAGLENALGDALAWLSQQRH